MIASATLLAVLLVQQQERVDPPSQEAQKVAEKIIRDVFKEDYAKRSPGERAALAAKLLEQAAQSAADPPSQYVLYREAKDIAIQGGDFALAGQALRGLGQRFKVAVAPMTFDLLATRTKSVRTPEEAGSLARAYLKLSEEAVVEEEMAIADKAADAANALARKAKDVALVASTTARTKAIADLKAKSAKLAKARETLATMPDDPAANLVVGLHEVTVQGNWEAGLPKLRKSSDPVLRPLAERDLGDPAAPADQAAAGDGWWDVSEKESGSGRDILRRRAVYWYQKAQPKLTGLNKTKVDRRISEAKIAWLHAGEWVDLSNPSAFDAPGKAGDPIRVKGPANYILRSLPPGEFTGVSMRVRFKAPAAPIIDMDVKRFATYLEANGRIHMARLEGGQYVPEQSSNMPVKEEYLVTLLLHKGEWVCHVDGQEKMRMSTTLVKMGGLGVQSPRGEVEFDQIKLRKAE